MKPLKVFHFATNNYFVPDGFVIEQASIWYNVGCKDLTRTYSTIIDLMLAGF